MWGGGAWQWGDSVLEEYVYTNDEAEDSAYLHSDSLSYYTESPVLEQDFYACSTSNTASVPTLYPDPGTHVLNFRVKFLKASFKHGFQVRTYVFNLLIHASFPYSHIQALNSYGF